MSTDYRGLIGKARDPACDIEPEDLVEQLADALEELLPTDPMAEYGDPGFVPSPELIDRFQAEPMPDGIVPPHIRDRIAGHENDHP